MIYLDSSYIVKCYVYEPGSDQVLELVEGRSGLTSCIHGRLEVWSAINRHVREGHLKITQARAALRKLAHDESDGVWNFLAITSELVATACDTVEALPKHVFVRSADALHLACAHAHGFTEIHSNDRHLLAAAEYFGLRARNVIAVSR